MIRQALGCREEVVVWYNLPTFLTHISLYYDFYRASRTIYMFYSEKIIYVKKEQCKKLMLIADWLKAFMF